MNPRYCKTHVQSDILNCMFHHGGCGWITIVFLFFFNYDRQNWSFFLVIVMLILLYVPDETLQNLPGFILCSLLFVSLFNFKQLFYELF